MAEYVRTAIVTGANSGLGFETTKALARQNIKVIMACRNLEKAEIARNLILKETPNANLRIIPLDLNSFNSIHQFAEEFKSRYKALHLLINNAGFMANKFELSEDGLETQYTANFLGHFLLTGLLLNRLKNSESSRIITVSSIAHRLAKIDFKNINNEQKYRPFIRYSETKLACLMFSYELNRRLIESKIPIISVAAHPGVSITNISHQKAKPLLKLQDKFGRFVFSDQKQGAESTIFSSLDLSVKGGNYYGPSGLFEIKGETKKLDSSKRSKNISVAKDLWHFAEETTKFKYPF